MGRKKIRCGRYWIHPQVLMKVKMRVREMRFAYPDIDSDGYERGVIRYVGSTFVSVRINSTSAIHCYSFDEVLVDDDFLKMIVKAQNAK